MAENCEIMRVTPARDDSGLEESYAKNMEELLHGGVIFPTSHFSQLLSQFP